nr:hypothetical protein CFP56_10432 [Quercus suber]
MTRKCAYGIRRTASLGKATIQVMKTATMKSSTTQSRCTVSKSAATWAISTCIHVRIFFEMVTDKNRMRRRLRREATLVPEMARFEKRDANDLHNTQSNGCCREERLFTHCVLWRADEKEGKPGTHQQAARQIPSDLEERESEKIILHSCRLINSATWRVRRCGPRHERLRESSSTLIGIQPAADGSFWRHRDKILAVLRSSPAQSHAGQVRPACAVRVKIRSMSRAIMPRTVLKEAGETTTRREAASPRSEGFAETLLWSYDRVPSARAGLQVPIRLKLRENGTCRSGKWGDRLRLEGNADDSSSNFVPFEVTAQDRFCILHMHALSRVLATLPFTHPLTHPPYPRPSSRIPTLGPGTHLSPNLDHDLVSFMHRSKVWPTPWSLLPHPIGSPVYLFAAAEADKPEGE